MERGTDDYAPGVLERYGYYRLSGYWHLYRARPDPPAPRFDGDGREIRLDAAGTEHFSYGIDLVDHL